MADVTFEEMEATANEPVAPDLNKQTVSGEGVPADLQGKTSQEVLNKLASMGEALRISEEARKNAMLMAEMATRTQAASTTPVTVAPAAVLVQDLTAEQLDELVKTDPTKALMLAMEQTRRKTTEALEARLGPMVTSVYSNTEAAARNKYADEFKMFGGDIQKIIDDVPMNKRGEVFSDPKAWDTMITYIRGQNMDKIVDQRVNDAIEKRLGTARASQGATAPVRIDSGVQAPIMASADGMVWDSVTLDIMQKVLGKDDSPATRAEWARLSKNSAGGM